MLCRLQTPICPRPPLETFSAWRAFTPVGTQEDGKQALRRHARAQSVVTARGGCGEEAAGAKFVLRSTAPVESKPSVGTQEHKVSLYLEKAMEKRVQEQNLSLEVPPRWKTSPRRHARAQSDVTARGGHGEAGARAKFVLRSTAPVESKPSVGTQEHKMSLQPEAAMEKQVQAQNLFLEVPPRWKTSPPSAAPSEF
jgi:hypothetical protein